MDIERTCEILHRLGIQGLTSMRKVLNLNHFVAIVTDLYHIDLPLECSVHICKGHMGSVLDIFHDKNTRQLGHWWIQREVIHIGKKDDMNFLYSLTQAIPLEWALDVERQQGNGCEKANPEGTEIYKMIYFE